MGSTIHQDTSTSTNQADAEYKAQRAGAYTMCHTTL